MSERDEFTDTSPITAVEDREGAGGRGPDEDPDEFVVRALERAQRVARNHGYIRSTLPSWGLDETRPRRTLDGSSEYAAIEIPNDFIVGYGLDYNQQGRNLRDIYTIVE